MNNSVFGRTVLNVREHLMVKNILNGFQNQTLKNQHFLLKIL